MSAPTLDEIEKFITDMNYTVSAKQFYEYYSNNKWCLSNGKKMKNWKKSVVTWQYSKYNKTTGSSVKKVDSMTSNERKEYYKVVENEL